MSNWKSGPPPEPGWYPASTRQDKTVLRFWWPATKSQPGWWSQGCEKTDSPEWAGKVAYQKTSFSRSLIQYLPRPAHWPDAYGNWPTVRMQEIAPDAELTALRAQVEALKETIHDELSANLRLRELGGARPDEDMTTFLERVFAERDKAGVHLVAWVEKDGSLVWHDSASAVGRNLYVKQ